MNIEKLKIIEMTDQEHKEMVAFDSDEELNDITKKKESEEKNEE